MLCEGGTEITLLFSQGFLSDTVTTYVTEAVIGRSALLTPLPPPKPYTRVFTSVETRVLNGVIYSGFHITKGYTDTAVYTVLSYVDTDDDFSYTTQTYGKYQTR